MQSQYNELDAELHVISDDEAASLLWAAQWLDEHREYAVTGIRLDDTADPDDEEDVTTTLVLTLDRAYEYQPGKLGPWPHGVPPLETAQRDRPETAQSCLASLDPLRMGLT